MPAAPGLRGHPARMHSPCSLIPGMRPGCAAAEQLWGHPRGLSAGQESRGWYGTLLPRMQALSRGCAGSAALPAAGGALRRAGSYPAAAAPARRWPCRRAALAQVPSVSVPRRRPGQDVPQRSLHHGAGRSVELLHHVGAVRLLCQSAGEPSQPPHAASQAWTAMAAAGPRQAAAPAPSQILTLHPKPCAPCWRRLAMLLLEAVLDPFHATLDLAHPPPSFDKAAHAQLVTALRWAPAACHPCRTPAANLTCMLPWLAACCVPTATCICMLHRCSRPVCCLIAGHPEEHALLAAAAAQLTQPGAAAPRPGRCTRMCCASWGACWVRGLRWWPT